MRGVGDPPEQGGDGTFTVLLVGAIALTLALSGLVVADLHAARGGGGTSTSTQVVGLQGLNGASGALGTSGSSSTASAGGSSTAGAGAGAGGGAGGRGGAGGGSGGGAGSAGVPSGPCGDCLPAGATIPLGSIVTQTGPGRSVTLAHAVSAWAQDVNRRGGINGHLVSLDVRDDGGNADTGASEYRTLDADEHVLALVGECAPITDAQEVGYVNQHGLPILHDCQSADSAYTSPWVWVAGPTPYENGQLAAKLAATTQGWPRGQGKIALVCLDQPAVASTCKGAEDYYGDSSLWSGHPQKEEIADSNYPQLIAQWRSDGVTDVHLVLEPGNTTRYLAAARDANWNVPTFQDLAIDDSIGANYANASGMLIGTPWTTLDQTNTPGMQRLTTTLQTYFPDDQVDIYAQTGWMGCLMLEHALQLMGPSGVSRSRLQAALNSFRSWNTGMGPTITFSPTNHVGYVADSLMQLQDAGTPGWRLVGIHGPVGL